MKKQSMLDREKRIENEASRIRDASVYQSEVQNSDTGDVAIQNSQRRNSEYLNIITIYNMLKVPLNASILNAKNLPVNSQLFTGIIEGKEGGI